MKQKIIMTLLALIWGFTSYSQIIPDYKFKHEDTTQPPNMVKIILEGSEVLPMLHDTIHALYEAGKDEAGLQKLLRWKIMLEQQGDTTSLDYHLVLTDLGQAMYQVGNYELAEFFMGKVTNSIHLSGRLGKSLIAMASMRMSAIQTMRGNLMKSEQMVGLAEESYGFSVDFESGYEFDRESILIPNDSSLHLAMIAQYQAAVNGFRSVLQYGENPAIHRIIRHVENAIEITKLQYKYDVEHVLDKAKMRACLLESDALVVRGGLKFANYVDLADLYLRGGESQLALDLIRRTRRMLYAYVSEPNQAHFEMVPYFVMQITSFEASIWLQMGKPQNAIQTIANEPLILEKFLSYAPGKAYLPQTLKQFYPNRFHLIYGLMQAYLDPKYADYNKAFATSEQFLNMYDQLYAKELGDEERIWLARAVAPSFQYIMAAAMHKFQKASSPEERATTFEKAMFWADGCKGRLLQSLWQQSSSAHEASLPDALRLKIERIRTEMYAIQAQRYGNEAAAGGLAEKEAQLQAEENRLFQEYAAENSKNAMGVLSENHMRLEDVQKALDPNEALVYFFEGTAYIFRFTIQQNTVQFDRIQRPGWQGEESFAKSRFPKQIHSLSQAYQTPTAYAATANALRELLWPWKDAATAPTKVSIFPDGLLWSIPFDALTYNGKPANSFQSLEYLLRKHEISYWPGLKMWEAARKFQPAVSDVPMMAACPGFLNTYPRPSQCDTTIPLLPDAPLQMLYEANLQLQKKYRGQFLLGDAATEAAIKKGLEQMGVLSIASHAVVNHEDPLASYISLYPNCDTTNAEDGRLYAYEVYRRNFPLELVMLWGCTTGGGKHALGEGLLSIARAFVASGAKSVLMSQWDMDEEPTARMMEYYYESLADGKGKAAALREAKLRLIENSGPLGAEPHRWAGWALVGDSLPLQAEMQARMNQRWVWALGAFVLAGCAWVVYARRRRKA